MSPAAVVLDPLPPDPIKRKLLKTIWHLFFLFSFFLSTNGRAWRLSRCPDARVAFQQCLESRKSQECVAEKETPENASYREKATEKGARPPKGYLANPSSANSLSFMGKHQEIDKLS